MSKEFNVDPDKSIRFSELKFEWSKLKRGSNATDSEKEQAKLRIQQIQKQLGLVVSNFENNSHGKKATVNTFGNKTLDKDYQKTDRFENVEQFTKSVGKYAFDILDTYYQENDMYPNAKEKLIAWEGLLKTFAIVWNK
jgi:hypothetical protein